MCSTNQWKQICWFQRIYECLSVFHLNETRCLIPTISANIHDIFCLFSFHLPSLFRTFSETSMNGYGSCDHYLFNPLPSWPRDQAFVLADGELISRFAKGLHLLTLHPHKISTSSAAEKTNPFVTRETYCQHTSYMTCFYECCVYIYIYMHKVGICNCPLFWQILAIVS